MVVSPWELWGGWQAGWSRMKGPLPRPKVAVTLQKHHGQAQPGFTLNPHPLPMRGEGSFLLRQGMGPKAGQGMLQSKAMWSPLLYQHPVAAFPSHFLPSFTSSSKMSSSFPRCHPLTIRWLSQHFSRAGGMQRDGEGGSHSLFEEWEGIIPD